MVRVTRETAGQTPRHPFSLPRRFLLRVISSWCEDVRH